MPGEEGRSRARRPVAWMSGGARAARGPVRRLGTARRAAALPFRFLPLKRPHGGALGTRRV